MVENIIPTETICEKCGRNADCFKGKCSYCSKLDFMFSQGAITLEKYNKLMGEWKNER